MARSNRKPTGRPRTPTPEEIEQEQVDRSFAQTAALYGEDLAARMYPSAEGALTYEGNWLTAVRDPLKDIRDAGPIIVDGKVDVKPLHRIIVWDLACADTPRSTIANILQVSDEFLGSHFAYELENAYYLMRAKTVRSVRRSADVGNMAAAGMLLKDHPKSTWKNAKGLQPGETDKVEVEHVLDKEFIKEVRSLLFEAASMTNSQRQSARKRAPQPEESK
jgi:hypothetical protein